MGKYYQDLDSPWFEYDLQSIEGVWDVRFRGPAIDRSRPYIACIGAAQTFGRFCAKPFPQLLGDSLGVQVLNLGIGGAGPRLFNSAKYLHLLDQAEAVIVQVLSGRSEGNTLFDNSKSGDLHGIRLQDHKSMRFEDFLNDLVVKEPPELVKRVVEETREQYVQTTVSLLQRISRPKVLFWFSNRSPEYHPDFSSAAGIMGPFPQLVDQAMVNRIRPHCDAYVECVSKRGIPQKLWRADRPVDGTALESGLLINRYYPSPEMQAEAAALLAPVCRRVLAETPRVPPTAVTNETTRFVILCAERTGSNLLHGLLDSHPACVVAGELFNPRLIERGEIWGVPQPPDRELLHLRQTDPAEFIERLFAALGVQRPQAIGFKLMYQHADKQPAAIEYLASQKSVRIIHLKRKNLLRRMLSDKRAQATDVWATASNARSTPLPPIQLPLANAAWNFGHIESKQLEYEQRFKGHPMLELFYEDLADGPQAVGGAAAAFLGLPVDGALEVRFKKTGIDSLREAIANYDELKAQFTRWAAFFEE